MNVFKLLLVFTLVSCAHNTGIVTEKTEKTEKIELPEQSKSTLTMIAVGDNLIHLPLINAAETETKKVYNFSPYYKDVEHLIRTADLAFINQESMIAGEEFGYSGYPAFNGPKDMANTISGLGFDIVNHATNHTMDKGERAIFAALENWKNYPQITVLGIHESEENRKTKLNIIEKNNIKIGLLSYTYGLNGIPLLPMLFFLHP
ncbi:hypothetical protein AGMMS50212_16080 [Spirochaetia bacterium]|nr:hypothetical protein AGMMS50212_16080 [Spirochaetia bacterium]